VPGEGERGIGAFVGGLANGLFNLITLPVQPVAIPGQSIIDSDLFRPSVLEIVGMVPDLIPFPVGVGRLRTRLVNGVGGDPQLILDSARTLVQAGAEISVVANAQEFGEEETVVVYFHQSDREKAQRLLDALGTGRLVRQRSTNDTYDVAVILGQDYADAVGGVAPPTTAVPGATVPSTIPTGGAPDDAAIPGEITPGAPGGEVPG
jgi:hypothetical protein